MGTSLRRRNIVDKTERRFVVGIIVLHGHFHHDSIFDSFKIKNIFVKRRGTSVQILNKFPDSAFIVKDNFLRLLFSFISGNDLQSFGNESNFPDTVF